MQSFWAPTFFATTKAGPQQRRFERDSVRRVLRTFGLSEHEAGMVAEYKKLWGEAWLTFEGFFRQFQTFPIILEAHSFFRTTAKESFMTLSSWLTRFENTFIWDRYCVLFNRYRAICEGRALCDLLPPSLHGLPMGMVFNYDGFPGGLIVHNGEPLTKRLCLRFDCKIKLLPKGPTESIRCWIEPFCDWLAALAERGWSPKQPKPLAVESALPLPEREKANPLLPWAVRALGAGPDSALLSWLFHVLRADPNTHPKAAAFCTHWKGRKCVAASQADIGFVLRLSEKQVKSAVARLRKEGFVCTERGRNKFGLKTMFTLSEDQCLEARTTDWEESEYMETWPVEWEPFRTLKIERRSRLMAKPRKSTFWSERGY